MGEQRYYSRVNRPYPEFALYFYPKKASESLEGGIHINSSSTECLQGKGEMLGETLTKTTANPTALGQAPQ